MATESLGRINSILKSSGKRTKELRRSSVEIVMVTDALMVVI